MHHNRRSSHNSFMFKKNSSFDFFMKTIHPLDPRSELIENAKLKELNGLIERRTFLLLFRSETGNNPNFVPWRFVLVTKHCEGSTNMYIGVSFILGGRRDRNSKHVVHSAKLLKQTAWQIFWCWFSKSNLIYTPSNLLKLTYNQHQNWYENFL